MKYINSFDITEVVCGEARGADSMGKRWAISENIAIQSFLANWELYGRKAGHKRNIEMAKYADGLLAFWDFKSRGTNNMINLSSKVYKMPTIVALYNHSNPKQKEMRFNI